jgi:hypothetical protein
VRRRFPAPAWCALALSCALSAACALAAPAPGGIADRARMVTIVRQVLKDRRYQTVMPRAGEPGPSIWYFRLRLLDLPRLLVILLAIVALALVLFWIVDALRRRVRAAAPAPDAAVSVAGPALEIVDAERLATSGRFSEAAHALLMITIQHLARRPDTRIDVASTSREIARGAARALAREKGEALGELVRRVEISWFGGRPLEAADYARCRECCRMVVEGPA